VADAVILAVAHRELLNRELRLKVVRGGCVIDVKAVLDAQALRRDGLAVWRL
jgi:UDP-N-acetyl-D-galactosamine dehydrogenase